MTTIIATIKPQHLANIREGRKLEEVRKNIPKAQLPIRVLCCESGSGGAIKCEFILDKYRVGSLNSIYTKYPGLQKTALIGQTRVCLGQLEEYMAGENAQHIYFWHISRMVDYCSTRGYRVRHISEFGLLRAPQSWCYVKEAV